MRNTFIETLCSLAEQDDRVWLVCGDLGFSVLEVFASKFPKRYLNAGVSEQNMTGLAAGLANTGKVVFTYSIANFPVMRCLEQIRNDVCYHHANVKIVAVGGGLAYGPQGYTHHGIEDLAVTRVLPNMTVIAPGDPVETRLATTALLQQNGPAYLRLGKANEPVVHKSDPHFQIGRAIQLRDGRDVTLVSTGGMLESSALAADQLAQKGVQARLLSMHTVQPLDHESLLRAASETGAIVTLEEHGDGGLASAAAEILVEAGSGIRFKSFRLPALPFSHAGSQSSLRNQAGLSVDAIVQGTLQLLNRKA